MGIRKLTQDNFKVLREAAKNGDMALMECTDNTTGKKVPIIAAVNMLDDGSFEFVPFAIMLEEDPYERFTPPSDKPDVK